MQSFSFSRSVLVGVGLLLLAACGSDRGQPTARTSTSALVSEPDHYDGQSLQVQQLALTFDDGPSALTSELSTYLKSQGIRATFFVNGARIQQTQLFNPNNLAPVPNGTAILQQLAADGHLVANHTTTHRNLVDLNNEDRVNEIAETDALIKQYGGTPWNRSLLRPPGFAWNDDVKNALMATAGHYVGPIWSDVGRVNNRYPKAADDSACFSGNLFKEDGKKIHSEDNDPLPDGYATSEECATAYIYELAAIGKGIVMLREGISWSEGGSSGNILDMVKYMVPILKQSGYTFFGVDEIPAVAADLPACTPGCYSCSGPGADECVACPKNSTMVDGKCNACTECSAGSFMEAACTPDSPPVCTACPADSFSPGGTAEACTSCSSCNDDNPCTTDNCSPTTGCSHTEIAECNAAPTDQPAPPAAAAPGDDASGCSVSATRTATGSGSLAALGAIAFAFATRARRIRRRR